MVYFVAALVCLSALVFACATYIREWHFKKVYSESIDLDPIQSYSAGVFMSSTLTEKDQLEIEKLSAEGKRELLDVIEKKLDNGKTIKIYKYKYVLSDGREIIMATNYNQSPEEMKANVQKKLEQAKKDYEEKVRRARREGKREIAKVSEVEVGGKVITTYIVKYKMLDGSEVAVGEGDYLAKELRSAVGQEFDQLTKDMMEKKGESLDAEEREIEGIKFIFSRRKLKLSDGREVIYSEGEPSD